MPTPSPHQKKSYIYGMSRCQGKKKLSLNQQDFVVVLNKTVVPLELVGYEMIIANLALRTWLDIYHLVSSVCLQNNC